MLAARDQENLVHGHQTAAAAKPLNRGGGSKTPGNMIPKTPRKVPLNDENDNLGGGKSNWKMGARRGNDENLPTGKKGAALGADKNAFVTPLPGARTQRAPLGMKTTNAKAKAFQTPAQVTKQQLVDELGLISKDRTSINASKRKPKSSLRETTKLDVFGDQQEDLEDLEEREIEYAPPKPIDLPDIDDDIPPLDPARLEELRKDHEQNPLLASHFAIGWDGLTSGQRDWKRREEAFDRNRRKAEAEMDYDVECIPLPCTHDPECVGEDCKTNIDTRKAAYERLQKILKAIDDEAKDEGLEKILQKQGLFGFTSQEPSKRSPSASLAAKPKVSPVTARARGTALQPKTATAATAKARLQTSLASRPKPPTTKLKPLPAGSARAPTSSSSQRHKAATANSKTTIGYSKGRSASASLQINNNPSNNPSRRTAPPSKTVRGTPAASTNARDLPNKSDKPTPEEVHNMHPKEYMSRFGEPRAGSAMWMKCWEGGYLGEKPVSDELSEEEEEDDDQWDVYDKALEEEDFQLVLKD